MIITFTKKIAIEPNFQPEFFFNRVLTAGGVYFHVSVLDKEDNFCHFTMAEIHREWKIVNAPQPPEWIRNIEKELSVAICKGMLS
jgi:hypothetical protein